MKLISELLNHITTLFSLPLKVSLAILVTTLRLRSTVCTKAALPTVSLLGVVRGGGGHLND